MRRWFFSMVVGGLLAVAAASAHAAPPKGWVLSGTDPASYNVGIDSSTRHGGRASGLLKSTTAKSANFGTLMQSFEPGAFAGKRVRLSGWIKADRVGEWTGMWMRVDDGSKTPLAFDNMAGRPIKATKDWTRYEIVLDVDAKAANLAFGVMLVGAGSVWLDDLAFDIVDRSVPTTDVLPKPTAATRPQNISFDD